jgi:hypothetical protein
VLVPGQLLSVIVDASAPGYLDGWIDFSGRHDWLSTEDQIFAGQKLDTGLNVLEVTVPSTAHAGETFARFRLSSQGGLKPTGAASDGEVEDYAVTVCPWGGATITTDKLEYRVGESQTVAYSMSEMSDVTLVHHLCDGTTSTLVKATFPPGVFWFAGSYQPPQPLTAKLPEGTQWMELRLTGLVSGCVTSIAAAFRVIR